MADQIFVNSCFTRGVFAGAFPLLSGTYPWKTIGKMMGKMMDIFSQDAWIFGWVLASSMTFEGFPCAVSGTSIHASC